MRRLLKRIIPFLISILMVVTLLPQVSMAADEDEPTTPLTELSIENLTIMEHTNGSYDSPGCYYYHPLQSEDLRVSFVYGNQAGEGTWGDFISFLTEQTGEEVEYEIITGQEDEAWEPGGTYPVEIKLLGQSASFFVTIGKHIEDFWVDDEITIVENTAGYWDETQGYYIYSPWNLELLNMGLTYDGTTYSGKWGSLQYEIPNRIVTFEFTGQSADNPWTVGNTYDSTLRISFENDGGSAEYPVKVTIVEDPITDFTIEDISIIANTSGSWYNEGSSDQYFYYYVEPRVANVSLTYKGVTYTGRIGQINWDIYSATGDDLSLGPRVVFETGQSAATPWEPGKTYPVTASVLGHSATFNVEVKENPLTSVVVNDFSIVENTTGYYNTFDDETYYIYNPLDSGKFRMTIVYDGKEYSGTAMEIRDTLNRLTGDNVYPEMSNDNQRMEHWIVGGSYPYSVSLMGVESNNFTVSIIANPLTQVTVEDYTFIENTGGYYRTDHIGEGEFTPEYFYYWTGELPMSIVYDNVTYTGTVSEIQEKLRELTGAWVSFNYTPEQSYENRWTVGNTYELTGDLMGVETTFNVSIIANPLSSFTIEDAELYPYSQGYFSGYHNYETGTMDYFYEYNLESLNASMVYDGVTYTGTVGQMRTKLSELTGDQVVINYGPRQTPNSIWTEGNTYEVTSNIMGITDTFKVTILESPVESLTVEDATYVEKTNGFYTKDVDPNTGGYTPEYYAYDSYFLPVSVVMKNGKTYSGRYSEVQELIYNDMGFRPSFFMTPRQNYTNQLTAGNTYTLTANLMGAEDEFQLSIVSSPLTAIDIPDAEIVEYTNGYITYNNYDPVTGTGTDPYYRYELYNIPMSITYNDMVIDGTFNEIQDYLYQATGERYQLDLSPYQSFENPWTAGNTYDVTATLMGVSDTFKLKINESPLTSISFDDVEIAEYSNGRYAQDMSPGGNSDKYFYYELRSIVNMTVVYDGKTYTGKYGTVIGDLYEATGQMLDVTFTPYQSAANPWTAGHTYEVTGILGGKSDTFNVTITESPMQSLHIDNVEILEGTSGSYRTYDDATMQYTDPWFAYTLYSKLQMSVVYGGKTYSGTYNNVMYQLSEDAGSNFHMELSSDEEQTYANQWGPGTYSVTAYLLGKETTFQVTIVPNKLTSITIPDIEVLEGTNGNEVPLSDGSFAYNYYPWDLLTPSVSYDGQVITGSLSDVENQVSDLVGSRVWMNFRSGQEDGEHWEAGKTYDVTALFMGKTCPFKVTIIPSVPPTGIQPIGKTDFTLYSLCSYKEGFLGVTYSPDNGNPKTNWTVADSEILSISGNEPAPHLWPSKAGTTTVTATSAVNPNLSQTFKVTVMDTDPPAGSYTTTVSYGKTDKQYGRVTDIVENPQVIRMSVGDYGYLSISCRGKDFVPFPGKFKIASQLKLVKVYDEGGGTGYDGDDIVMSVPYYLEATTEGTQEIKINNDYTITLIVGSGSAPYGNTTGLVKDENGNLIYVKNGVPDTTKNDIISYKGDWYCVKNGVVDPTLDSVEQNANGWWCIHDGKVDFSYTGFERNANGWWYCEKGQVTFKKNDILKGVANNDPTKAGVDGWWYVKGSQVVDVTTVASNAYGWWYVKNGKVDFGYTGVQNNSNGWWYIKGGQVDFNYNGFGANEHGWWYCEKGQVKFNKNDIISGKANTDPTAAGVDGWWYVKGSQVIDVTTVAQNAYGWWYVKNGKVDFDYTGVQNNSNGWWYIKDGKVDFNYTGFGANEHGWWYCEKGQVKFNKNDIISGKANTDPLAEGVDGWWYVKGSQVIKIDTVAQNAYGWWAIFDGKVDFTFTGLAENEYGTWYCVNGKVDFSYTGPFDGRDIVNGKAS